MNKLAFVGVRYDMLTHRERAVMNRLVLRFDTQGESCYEQVGS